MGAVGGTALADPRALGLDAAAPAAFLVLLAPRLSGRTGVGVALAAASGVPVLVSALVVAVATLTTALLRLV